MGPYPRPPSSPGGMARHARTLVGSLLAVGLAGTGGPLPAVAGSLAAQEPEALPTPPSERFEFTTDEAFDAASISPYAGEHGDVYAHIDAHLEDHIGNLQRWVRQRSISAQDVGIDEMAEMLRADLEGMGFREAELVPTAGHPGVWGWYDAGAEKTLVLYMMYDVQPVNPEDWESPPFEASLVETEHGTVLMGRGATNQKGPERALLNAIESVIAVTGTLPVNLMVAAEGEEEIGSAHYPEIVDAYEDRLRTADGAFFPFNAQSPAGEVSMSLGVKGILYTEIEARGGAWGGPTEAEIHGSYKAIVDAPAWRLVRALGTLVSEDGNTILVPGYYDEVRPPTLEEQRLVNGMVEGWNDAQLRAGLGVETWIDGVEGRRAILRYLYDPTLNIDGIRGGYTGEGVKTILPHVATAKVDSRLPPDVDPDRALERIRDHLAADGFPEIEVRKLEGYPAAQTSVEAPLVQAALGVFRKHGITPTVSPRLAGSAPFYQFTDRLDLPMVFTGMGHGSGAHAPNEYMVIHPREGSGVAGLAEVEKAYVDLLYALAER